MRLHVKRPARSTDESIVPLINIVFLLLVFFMLAGTIEPADPFDVEPPQSAVEPGEPQDGVTVLVGPDGAVALGGEPVPPVSLARRLKPLRESDPGQRILVKADALAPASAVLPVLQAIGDGGFDSVVLVTVGRRSP